MMAQFRIITLDAERIVTWKVRDAELRQDPDTRNYEIRRRFNLSGNSGDRAIIFHTDFQPNNALFFQLASLLQLTDKDPERLLEHALVYIDFSRIFQKQNQKNFGEEKFFDESYLVKPYTLSKEKLTENNAVVNTSKLITLFEYGIELSFDGNTYKRFVPFDKSASMSRHSTISFIDAELKELVELRLMLDMDFAKNDITVQASKYFAYRGLYMTTGTRIEGLPLNEETVIVLDDFIENIPATEVFTAKLKPKTGSKNSDEWDFYTVKKSPKINLFDGEGLISPPCAYDINKYLRQLDSEDKYKFRGTAHSFQIRMPFTKGVLHEVDFVKFFIHEFGLKNQVIEDVFGVKRYLSKARIILTKSMFKCANWLKEYCKALELGDPMKFFFGHFAKYKHALYVLLTDANLRNSSRLVKLDHQFLSTLALTPKSFSSLVEQQIQSIKDLPDTLMKNFYGSDSEDDEELPDDKESSDLITRDKMFSIAAHNDAFLQQQEVKNAIIRMQLDLEFDLALGKLQVHGERRWFSCDLLALLLRIARRLGANKDKIADLGKQTLQPKNFYMPKSKLPLADNQPCVVLRSPHLSRNEQILLNAYVAPPESLYEKYFSQLGGIVMISCKSSAAMALGGADYDGDYVKVITDDAVLEAVTSLHTSEGERTLPVIEIPSGKSESVIPPKNISFAMANNALNSQVGRISNLAIKILTLAAKAATPDEKTKLLEYAARCTILTGLDIDAAKTGRHPTKNILELAKMIGKTQNLFLKCKDTIKELRGLKFFSPDIAKKRILPITKQKFEDSLRELLPKLIEPPATYIELLPQLYLEYIIHDWGKDSLKLSSTNKFYFEFQRDDNWQSKLDKTKLEQVKWLVKNFNAVLSHAKKVADLRKWWTTQDHSNFVYTILKIQYDDNAHIDELPVEEVKLLMYSYLENLKLENVAAALEALKKSKWHLTPPDLRQEKLAEILGIKLPPKVISLLKNFNNNGYMLLYCALLSVKAKLATAVDPLDSENTDADIDDKFFEIYAESIAYKPTRSVLKNNLISMCRKKLSESKLFGADFNEALKYYWANRSKDSSSHEFFRSVFTEKEILSNLPKVPEKGGDRNAQ